MTPTNNRVAIVDDFRGIAVLLMAVFHFCYDLSVFGFITFEMNGGFFTWFRFLIVTLFFTSVGAGLFLAHGDGMMWRKFWVRESKIVAGAIFISLSTLFLYPKSWVWFGVLHFIAVASFLVLPFLKFPKISVVTGVTIFLLYNLTSWFNLHFLWEQFSRPLSLPRGTQDLTRLVPWVGMVLIGIYLGKTKFFNLKTVAVGVFEKPIRFLSKHSLIVYIVHQPPLFGLAWLLDAALH